MEAVSLREGVALLVIGSSTPLVEKGSMTEVGTGVIDFASVLANEAASGLRHLFVEHDQPTDPFKSVAISHLSLASMLD